MKTYAIKYALTALLSFVLVLLTACGESKEKDYPTIPVSEATALELAKARVYRKGDSDYFWREDGAYTFEIKYIYFFDELACYEVNIFDEAGEPAGYINVPAIHEIEDPDDPVLSKPQIATFFPQDRSPSAYLIEGYEQKWLPRLQANGITPLSYKVVGGLHGAWGVAVKTDNMDVPIVSAKRKKDYYVFTDRLVEGFYPEISEDEV